MCCVSQGVLSRALRSRGYLCTALLDHPQVWIFWAHRGSHMQLSAWLLTGAGSQPVFT